jgi:hypothetical protein
VCQNVKQRPQNFWSRTLEVRPQCRLGTPLRVADRRHRQDDCPIREIRSCDHILDGIEEHRPCGLKQHFRVVGVELAHREAAAAREPAERVGDPDWPLNGRFSRNTTRVRTTAEAFYLLTR